MIEPSERADYSVQGAIGTIKRFRGVPPGWGRPGWDFDGGWGTTENQKTNRARFFWNAGWYVNI
jgi:hypothetical protein